MYRVLIALFCIIFVIGINGASIKLPTSIDRDAIEMAQLFEKFWSLVPAVLQNTQLFIYCQVIDKCCGDEHRSQAISLFGSVMKGYNHKIHFNEVIKACVNSTAQDKADQWCPTYDESIISISAAEKEPDVKIFTELVDKYSDELIELFFDRIYPACINEELHAVWCLSSKKLVETCFDKMLRGINDNDGHKVYQKFTVKTKQLLIDLNQQLS